MADAQARARRALEGAGLDPATPLERATSHANEVWLAEDYALRVNFRGDLGRLRREFDVASAVPEAARYPPVLDYGTDGVLEWMTCRRVPGVVLSRAWPGLTTAERRRATHELGGALRALHTVDDVSLPDDHALDPPHILPLNRLLDLVARVDAGGKLRRGVADALAGFVEERWDAFDGANRGLVHGDPHLENVLWGGDGLSAVLDLEWARRSWIEVDLETLLSFYDHPALVVSEQDEHLARAEDYREAPSWLAEAHPQLFAHPRLVDRLLVLHVSRVLTVLVDAEGPVALRTEQLDAVLESRCFLAQAVGW